ncbi:CBO0543 family protein [Neobacillus sp. OS1-32]|uniref:Uncharacterized protein n=1 Tax=Neobacillus paridis TaxID=2803862 RepID=A0ABS1TP40_9BACI|nr:MULTISPECIES: CBO0543 family protein [Neobacillus]MBL4953116.1 hypothetical protein [Neobacillus paridis]WML28586.1 CBO0543 family protein [Neobacillus sp. OS1-32]
MNVVYALIWLFAFFKWGDLKNWHKYYPTYLFFLLGDFLYLYLLSDCYPMWKYNPQGIDENIGLTNAHVSFSIMAIKYPTTTFIYLSKFPEKRIKQILYITGWVLLYIANELVDNFFNLIKYYNGWNLAWSILFNVVMFITLRVHYTRPWLAWLFSFVFVLFLWKIFDVPNDVFR